MDTAKTFAFVDLAGFVALTEAHGDETAADLAARFVSLSKSELRNGEAVVKSIGDAVMLVAPDPEAGATLVERICMKVDAEAGFPVLRAGLHHGSAIERNGDWFGAAVNLAARVAGEASGGQVLCTAAVADGAAKVVQVRSLGVRNFRHVSQPVEIFEVLRRRPTLERVIDPVCHMSIDPSTSAVRLTHAGRDHWFCSLTCAHIFTAAPDRTLAPTRRRPG